MDGDGRLRHGKMDGEGRTVGLRFGTSGVRGIYGSDIDERKVFGFFSGLAGTFIVSADARISSLSLKHSAISSLVASGSSVVDIGHSPTGVAAFMSKALGHVSVQFTASHNPPEYAGFKLFRNGIGMAERPLPGKAGGNAGYGSGAGRRPSVSRVDAFPFYYSGLLKFMHLVGEQRERLVVDVGNGAGHWYCSRLLSSLGWRFETVHDWPDAENPARGLEPTPESVSKAVKYLRSSGGGIGAALDGDADRVVFFDAEGFIGYNEAIALFSRKFLERTGGKSVVTTVETGMVFDEMMKGYGVERTRVGDMAVAARVLETGAAIGVEQPGHYIIPSFYPAPDVFLPMLAFSSWFSAEEIREELDRLERPVFLKEKYHTGRKHEIMERLDLGIGEYERIDGILARGDGWRLLVRASGTENVIRVIAEAYDRPRAKELMGYALEKIKEVEENEGYTVVRGDREENETAVG